MSITAKKVWFENEMIYAELNTNKIIGVPLTMYPRLQHATKTDLNSFELWSDGEWIHWEKLDEDLSAEGFLKYSHQQSQLSES